MGLGPNLQFRSEKIDKTLDAMLKYREAKMLPTAVVRGIHSDMEELRRFAYGGTHMDTIDEHVQLLRGIADRQGQIKRAFESARDDAVQAEALVKEMAGQVINNDIVAISELYPNDRLSQLLQLIK